MGKILLILVVTLPLFGWDMIEKLEELKRQDERATDRELEEKRVERGAVDKKLEKKRVERRAIDRKLEQQRVERRIQDRRRNG